MWKRKAKTTLPLGEIPSGSYLKTEAGYFFVKSTTSRYRLTSLRNLASWAPPRVVEASENDPSVKKMKVLAKMKFRNGSLIWNLADGKIYLIESGKRRHVVSPDALERIGAVKSEIQAVSLDEINIHPEGEDFS